jgi:hypothetical protein
VEVLGDEGNNSSCSGDVLPEEEGGLALVGDSDVLVEEARAISIEALPLPSKGQVLAWRSASDEIHESHQWASVEGAYIVPDRRLW